MTSTYALISTAKQFHLWLDEYHIGKKDLSIEEIVNMYHNDLPSQLHCQEELVRWKRRWSACEKIAKALKECDNELYTNLSVLLKVAGTVAVTSCECERSGSVLKRLNTYLRASM